MAPLVYPITLSPAAAGTCETSLKNSINGDSTNVVDTYGILVTLSINNENSEAAIFITSIY
jgi:hypothetical protein